ncbi:Transcription initiation protein spt3 [Podila epigama]|nr:Transcription initiation protein spt3 [Podila epigama]
MADSKDKTEKEKSRYRYQSEIQQMMFVFGEVSDAIQETTMLVEDIVRSQVIEIVCQGAQQARKRGSRFMSAEDLIFLIRHDRPKVNRLRTYLSWKDVRKNVKDSSDGAGGPGADDVAGIEDAAVGHDGKGGPGDGSGGPGGKNSSGPAPISKARRMRVKLTKRFRDWANMSTYIDMRPNDDIIDILGFLTFEMVTTLTETALKVKKEEDEKQRLYREAVVAAKNKNKSGADSSNNINSFGSGSGSSGGAGGAGVGGGGNSNDDGQGEDSRNSGDTSMDLDEDIPGLFSLPPSEQSPLQPRHIREAFRRLQRAPLPIKNYCGGLARTKVSLI